MGTAVMDYLLLEFGGLWLLPFVALLDSFAYDLVANCSSDPPALPVFSEQDVLNLLPTSAPEGLLAVIPKISQAILHFAWFKFCQCTSGTLQDPGAFPQPPGTVYIPNSGGPLLPPGTVTCGSFDSNVVTYTDSPTTSFVALLGIQFHNGDGSINANRQGVALPTGATTFQATARNLSTITGIGNQRLEDFQVIFLDATHTFVQGFASNGVFPGQLRQWGPFAIPATAVSFILEASSGAGDGLDRRLSGNVTTFCPPSGAGAATPCQQDPGVIQLLQQIYTLVQLIQRVQVPFAYIRSAVHGNLTGSGTIAIGQSIGVMVSVTGFPAGIGQVAGTPVEYFQLGWINWGNGDAYTAREWLHVSPQFSFPCDSQVFTTIGYSLQPGVTISIQEIHREA